MERSAKDRGIYPRSAIYLLARVSALPCAICWRDLQRCGNVDKLNSIPRKDLYERATYVLDMHR